MWKIIKIAEPELPSEITQIIDTFDFQWKEDYGFYNTKAKESKNK